MKKLISLSACILAVCFLILGLASISDAGAQNKKKDTSAQTAGEEQGYQQSGQPLYFDPEKAEGKGVDDAAPYSDPWYGKEEKYKGGHGSQPGTPGDVTDEPQKKVIEGPVRYERVE